MLDSIRTKIEHGLKRTLGEQMLKVLQDGLALMAIGAFMWTLIVLLAVADSSVTSSLSAAL
jgi:hypothetical protein